MLYLLTALVHVLLVVQIPHLAWKRRDFKILPGTVHMVHLTVGILHGISSFAEQSENLFLFSIYLHLPALSKRMNFKQT